MIKAYSRQIFTLFIACLIVSMSAIAQENNNHTIRLKSGTITAPANARKWIEDIMAAPPAKEPQQVLIQFSTLPTKEQRAQLQQSGITLLDYVPDNTYTALIQYPLQTATLSSVPIYGIVDIRPEWKADAYTWNKINVQNGTVEVLVTFYSNIDAAAIKQFLTIVGAQINKGPMEQYHAYKVVVAANKVRTIAQWYGVQYISPVSDMVPLDLQSRPVVKGNIAVVPPMLGGYGLAGDSVTVGVGDNSSGIHHADLDDRITNFNPAPLAHHGAHVNGIVGAAANVDPFAASMAPHVSLVDYLYDQILPATGAMYRDFNMTVTNNSYEVIAANCDYAGTYDGYAHFLDSISVAYPNVLHVFASGNDGWMECPPYVKGFATVGGGYQPAKNIIVVGSITDYMDQAADESRGPVKDGRLKPEMVAVGLGSYSTIAIDQYMWAAGTSMAAPMVAGGLANLTQRYKQLHGGAQPPADILKTIMLNGAMDLGLPGPDFTYGYGVMDMYRSLQIIDQNHYMSGNVGQDDSQSYAINIPANTGQLKVMLCWLDAPASPLSSKQLVNDVDLSVVTPSSVTHLPLVPDPTPANVNNIATEQIDHLNNVEQVTIENPASGNYTIKVKGYNVPSGTQRYVIAYDIVPKGLYLTYPLGGEQLSIDSMRIFWDAVSDGNTFTVQFSSDNGSNWTTISNNIPADVRHGDFQIPSTINSGNCIARVMRNNTSEVVTSGRFAINTAPRVLTDTAQCPGYLNIHWSPVPNATSYYLLKKKGFYMQVVDSTTDTTYTFSGLPTTSTSYVSVQPIINGIPGYRSIATKAIANTGNCTKTISNGDLMAERIVSPQSGRMFTGSQLTASTPIQVKVRNLYQSACTNYTVSYQVNSGLWHSVPGSGTIPANSSTIVTLAGPSFAAVGSYAIKVAIHNLDLTDPQPSNDTTMVTVLNLPNDTVNVNTAFVDDFESMGKFAVAHDSIGVSPNAHWDFFNQTDTGRLRSFVNDDITISGDRSISLDQTEATDQGSKNTFVGTFNLSNYDTVNKEIRVDFDYILHGTPKATNGNIVSARGDDASTWNTLYQYDLSAYPGYITHVRSLSLTDAVRQNHRNFSTSTQISFGQNDTSLIALTNYGNGITMDNFKIYTVSNDAALAGIVSPVPDNCGLPASVPLIIQVHNGVQNTLHNVHVFYSVNGATYTGTIDSIKGKATISYTFSQQLNIAGGTTQNLNVWLTVAGDTYTRNDSILNYRIRNSKIINNFPYLENFENGDGGYYTDGFNNSWQYGTPASQKINRAASGTKAWKTNLAGRYNNLEKSYLYTPCFDVSGLVNPMLSFSAALDIENCGSVLCDAAYVEYSFDGNTWHKLGMTGQGTNWYDSTFNVWNTPGFTRWHVASIPIPLLGGGQATQFRFVLAADPGTTLEGFAVDDIHIYDLSKPIYSPSTNAIAASQETPNNQWNDFTLSNQLLAAVQPTSGNGNNVTVTLYAHDTLSNPTATQYTFPRSYTIKSDQSPAGSTGIRLYLTDSEVVQVLNDTTCPSCSPIADAYALGITQYHNTNNSAAENETLADDTGGTFRFYPYRSVKWVPYDKGYYAELYVKPLSEFWFNDGGPTGNFPAGVDYLNFMAFRSGSNVTTYWYSLIDTAVHDYELQRSDDSTNFTAILNTAATHTNPGQYSYIDPVNFTPSTVLFYRLQWRMNGRNVVYTSPIRKVTYEDSAAQLVKLDAQMVSHNSVLVNWISYIDGIAQQYKLERAIDDGPYTGIDNVQSLHHYGQQYSYIDIPAEDIRSGALIHYRLTMTLQDGSSVVLPVRTIRWISRNTVATVYPNPNFNGSFTIGWYADAGTNMHVRIADVSGREVFETSVTASQWYNTTELQTGNLSKGVYVVYVEIGGKRSAIKVVYE